MLNSILILGSTYNKNKKINIIFALVWLIYMLAGSNLKTGLIFIVMNILAFGLVFALGKAVKGKHSNAAVSIFGVLIWSIIIDIICYFIYPQFTMGQNILTYIGNGILFNYKYVIGNALILGGAYIIPKFLHSYIPKLFCHNFVTKMS
ncbi:MAG: hypothetical protein FWC53_04045 [Firmicutes bacterium]|nr:hypothetical protein [Bacillota bacterium]